MNEEAVLELKGLVTKQGDAIKEKQAEIEKAIKEKASVSVVEDLQKDLGDKYEKLEKSMDAAQKHLDELARAQAQRKGQVFETQGDALKAELKAALTPERIHKIKATREQVAFEIKAAANMVSSNTVTSGSRIPLWDREPGVAKQPDRAPFILDLVSIGALNSDTISWVERTDRQGFPATNSAEGAKYGQLSTTYTEFSAVSQYSTVYTKVSNKNIEDIDFMLDEINSEIVNALELGIDAQLLSGNGTAPNHKGILQYAPTFSAPSGFTPLAAPTDYDVLAAAVLLIQIQRYYPTAIVLHPTDAKNMMVLKDTLGRYLEPYFVTQNDKGVLMFMGLPIVENLGVTPGTFLVGDFSKAKFFLRRGIAVNIWDQNEDDAVKGFKTITGVSRGAFRVKGVEVGAFVQGTFSTAATAIKAV